MSTEHKNPHELEYGPTPPGAKHEHTDIDAAVGYKFALWLAVSMVLSAGIVYGTFWFFENQMQEADAVAQTYPLSVGQPKQAPAPNLQTQPFQDIYTLREAEATRLGSYGWVDKEGGIARIPIDRAMELILQQGLPTRPDGVAPLNVVTQDSSSGRTIVPR